MVLISSWSANNASWQLKELTPISSKFFFVVSKSMSSKGLKLSFWQRRSYCKTWEGVEPWVQHIKNYRMQCYWWMKRTIWIAKLTDTSDRNVMEQRRFLKYSYGNNIVMNFMTSHFLRHKEMQKRVLESKYWGESKKDQRKYF